MIAFMEKTWFLWWILATLVILRWFHLLSSGTDSEGAFEASGSAKENGSTDSKQIPPGTASSLFT